MSNSSNAQSQSPDDERAKSSQTSETTSQNGYHKVTFGEVLLYFWSQRDSSSNSNSPTPFQLWFGQNVFPLLTPMRIFFFSLGLISSLLAFATFTQTEFYKSNNYRRQLLFVSAFLLHTLLLIFILFFRFCTVDRRHYVLKSFGEVAVLVLVSCLMLEIGHKYQNLRHGSSDEVVVLATTCVLMDVDAICLINLLTPGHHFSLLETIVTLTLHLGLLGSVYLRIFAMCFVFLILFVKNFQWRHVADAQAPSNEQHNHLVWVALEAV